MGLQIKKLNASTSREINETFANFARERPDAIFIGPDAFFNARRVQLALLAAFHRLPVIYPLRPFTEAGGLMSYGSDIVDAYRQVGSYAGRILKGALRPRKKHCRPGTSSTAIFGSSTTIRAETARR